LKIFIVGLVKLGTKYGGGELYIQNLVYGLRDRGHVLTYFYISFSDNSFPSLTKQVVNGLEEMELSLPKDWLKKDNHSLQESILEKIHTILSAVKPDLLHAHGLKDCACMAAAREDIPCIVTAHHGGIVCPAGALLNANDAICRIQANDNACLKCCTRSIPGWRFWFPLIKIIPLKARLWLGKWLRRLPFIFFVTPLGTLSCNIRDKMKVVLDIGHYANKIIAPSPAIAEALVRNGIPEQKIKILSHGISLPQRQPLRSDFGTEPLRFLFVGRISYGKGLHIMLKAFSQLPSEKYVLHIVGGAVKKGEKRYEAQLKRKYASVNAVWHGTRPYEEIAGHIAWCDIMLHPTVCLEVFGLNIAESLAVGRLVIATRCGGAEAQIHEGKNGFLIPPNDPGALRDRLLNCIENPLILKEMSAQAVLVNSLDHHISELEAVYQECLK